ncbi:Inositol 2-dehydrogenase [Rubripirellula tenax]|uniref:Inositol 2-dehydrogenase n=1 Tax=Rubripirellula tenax TaxID=2528015 RepID=A0A5C6FDG9_9BACT|nr:Gfo/Idh/MocA family oxidoreductase [Rubripirellula tenax]TWU58630.1 Inositol 2-dehydrogenase [Rubripirellula tenax]
MNRLNRRHFLVTAVAAGAATASSPSVLRAANANGEINLGFISCGGRAGQLMDQFSKVDGVNIAGLCDVDEGRLAAAKKKYSKAETFQDMRDLIAVDSIDAIVVATCNHWHCLAAIWAMEAGKDVYVEKPLSHSQWEGRQTVAAARKYNKICQIGTQQRSDPMQAEIKKFLHEEKGLGEIQSARVNRYGIRGPIGKRDTPLEIDKNVAYDMWLGPAQDQPIFRNNLHYDWHWDWNTGSGEMGNWGVHVLDDVRNTVFQDSVSLPKQILGGGGRIAYNDAGQSPNVHFAYFDTGNIPVVIGLSNLPAAPGGKKSPSKPGPDSGYVAYCEGGRYEGQRGRGTAFDNDGKKIRTFKGSGDVKHQANFIEAVRAQDRSLLNADISIGNDSTGWCNLANIAFRAGQSASPDRVSAVDNPQWESLLGEMTDHLKAYDMSLASDEIHVSPLLSLDTKTEQFTGEGSETANAMLRRQYRKGYEVPEIV